MKPIPLIVCAATLLLAAPAFAATAATPLQTQMAEKMLDFIGFKAQVQLSMENGTLPQSLLDTRPDWKATFKVAIAEELDHDMPVIDSMIGQTLGRCATSLSLGHQVNDLGKHRQSTDPPGLHQKRSSLIHGSADDRVSRPLRYRH